MSDEMIELIMDQFDEKGDQALAAMNAQMNKVRTGRVSPQLVNDIKVEYYGSLTPLSQMAAVNIIDNQTLKIEAWDKSAHEPIDKALRQADVGGNPIDKGDHHLIIVPAMTEERRKEMVKKIKVQGEDAKIQIRNLRRDAMSELKKIDAVSEDLIKRSEQDVQAKTDAFINDIDQVIAAKSKEVMTV